jgi:hypothetical protein
MRGLLTGLCVSLLPSCVLNVVIPSLASDVHARRLAAEEAAVGVLRLRRQQQRRAVSTVALLMLTPPFLPPLSDRAGPTGSFSRPASFRTPRPIRRPSSRRSDATQRSLTPSDTTVGSAVCVLCCAVWTARPVNERDVHFTSSECKRWKQRLSF